MTKWISIKDELPKIPKGKHGIVVIAAVFDKIYEEINPGHGYTVQILQFSDGKFLDLTIGPNGWDFMEMLDPVTHWMYLPKPPTLSYDKGE